MLSVECCFSCKGMSNVQADDCNATARETQISRFPTMYLVYSGILTSKSTSVYPTNFPCSPQVRSCPQEFFLGGIILLVDCCEPLSLAEPHLFHFSKIYTCLKVGHKRDTMVQVDIA